MPIVALDRDGVINYDSSDYIKSEEEWQPLPGSIEAIKLLCDKGYRVYVATNQAGLARGLFQPEDLAAMHRKLIDLVEAEGGQIEAIMFCPHHPDDNCDCRKPKPGLLKQIEQHAKESMVDQYFVGDSFKDVQAAEAINAAPVVVLTGNGDKTKATLVEAGREVPIFKDLLEFAVSL